jgi:hypothetical protein
VSGQWFVVKPRSEWAAQVRDAIEEITAANGGTEPATIRQGYDIAPAAFGRMIEGLVALGAQVDDELISLAGLRDVGEFL